MDGEELLGASDGVLDGEELVGPAVGDFVAEQMQDLLKATVKTPSLQSLAQRNPGSGTQLKELVL